MSELLKNIYSPEFIDFFCASIRKVHPSFDAHKFHQRVFNTDWISMQLKQRMRHISTAFHEQLSQSFSKDVFILAKLIKQLKKDGARNDGFEYMFIPDYIEVYGIDHLSTSLKAIERITQFVSCEFAIRPYILQSPSQTINQMLNWATHKNASVRRLATEGCRPRLPWAMGLPFLKLDPTPIWPILQKLKDDGSESVRRSVANNLNDISKDHPDLIISIAKQWLGKSDQLDALIKHGCRTLLKQGYADVMPLFGFGTVDKIMISSMKIHTPNVKIGDALEFSFALKNNSKKDILVRLEYGIYYRMANGSLSKKVFKISEKRYESNRLFQISRRQSFQVISTRKFHLGLHQVSIIINGIESERHDFSLVSR